jgi:hypothetical protein
LEEIEGMKEMRMKKTLGERSGPCSQIFCEYLKYNMALFEKLQVAARVASCNMAFINAQKI